MQPDRFTTKSQEAVAGAQRLAAAHRNTEVAPAHLLLALLEQEDGLVAPGPPARRRRRRGDPRRRVDRDREPRDLSGGDEPESRPSPGFVKVLQRAEKEAAAGGDEYISTDHILLALADKASGIADLLPPREELAKAIEVRGPQRVTCPTPRTRSRRSRSSAAT